MGNNFFFFFFLLFFFFSSILSPGPPSIFHFSPVVLPTYADGQSGVSTPSIHPFARKNVNVRQRLNTRLPLSLRPSIDLSGQGRRMMPFSPQPSIHPAVPSCSVPPELLPIQAVETPSVVFNETCSPRSRSPRLVQDWGRLYTIQTLRLMTPGRTCSSPFR